MKKELEVLLGDLALAYEKSDIKQYCARHHLQWNYELLTSPFVANRPLIVGFNWGATTDYAFRAPTGIETEYFLKQDLASLRRVVPYLSRFLGDDQLKEISQSNICLFRSQRESQISTHDLQLCWPIFSRLVAILKPSYLIGFSAQLKASLCQQDLLEDIQTTAIRWQSGARDITYTACKAYLKGVGRIYFLPHPNYPLPRTAREQAWAFCFANTHSSLALEASTPNQDAQ
jgi:hypothetical protein